MIDIYWRPYAFPEFFTYTSTKHAYYISVGRVQINISKHGKWPTHWGRK